MHVCTCFRSVLAPSNSIIILWSSPDNSFPFSIVHLCPIHIVQFYINCGLSTLFLWLKPRNSNSVWALVLDLILWALTGTVYKLHMDMVWARALTSQYLTLLTLTLFHVVRCSLFACQVFVLQRCVLCREQLSLANSSISISFWLLSLNLPRLAVSLFIYDTAKAIKTPASSPN